MKKYLSIFFVLLTVLLSGCSSDYHTNDNTSAKAVDGVPDEVIYELMNSKYNYHQQEYKQNPGRKSKPTYSNSINVYQRVDTMIDVNNFIVNLKATVSSEICTKDVELRIEYQFSNGSWRVCGTNEIINNVEWHYSKFTNCWWVGGAGLYYRAFFINDINTEEKTMNIIDGSNREYTTNYEFSEDEIVVNIKYDTVKWVIESEGPKHSGYFMKKEN